MRENLDVGIRRHPANQQLRSLVLRLRQSAEEHGCRLVRK